MMLFLKGLKYQALNLSCCRFGLKTGIHFAHFDLESGMVFQGTTECTSVMNVSK